MKYEKPEMEIVEFKQKDVVTESVITNTGDPEDGMIQW